MQHIRSSIIFIASIITMVMILPIQRGLSQEQSFNIIWLCDSTHHQTFYRTILNDVNHHNYIFGNFKPNGSTYNPSSPIIVGPCAGSSGSDTIVVSFTDSAFQYTAYPMCDDSLTTTVSFQRIYRFATKTNTGIDAMKFIGDFRSDNGNSYTPSTQIYAGNCGAVDVNTGSHLRAYEVQNTIDTIQQSTDGLLVSISNIGNDTAILYINSDTLNLQVKSTWFCNMFLNPINQIMEECPQVIYDCSATRLQITKRRKS